MKNFQPKLIAVAVALAATGGVSTPSFAQSSETLEEIVTIGTRGKPRSTTDSLAPVDVISGSDFTSQGGVDTSDLLRNVVPSFNVNDQPISDAATLVRPANLRGLAPDHTLVLVNGKRRHRSSVITWLGNGLADGSQGPDIAAIPAIALKSVEVLRDGAAAQYGSDAIAGVVNFNLKDSDSGGSFEARYGQYTEGENAYTFSWNQGFAVGDNGFLNLSAEYTDAEATDRSVQRADAAALIAAGYPTGNPAQVWGTPEVEGDVKLWANFGSELANGMEVFGQANYNSKEVIGGFYFRNPTNRGGVYSGDGGETLLIGDLTPNDGRGCPTVALNGVVPDPTAFAQVVADPNCFSFQETIPGGFTPSFGGDVTDSSLLVGLRGETDGGLNWSVSTYYGNNEADFFINNTVNASLGPRTPRDFNPGAYEQTDFAINADFTMGLSDTVSLGFGAEYRKEEFALIAGQPESYIDGGLGTQGFSTSSNGFPGFSPSIAGEFDRANTSLYADLEWEASDALLIGAAIRFEDFDDFGSTTNFKLGANYAINDNGGLRATVSTGFKAPTPGQSNASNISTSIQNGILVNQGVIPSTSGAALLRGGSALQPEESTNITLGTYFNVGSLDVTVDYFDIDVDDRLNISSTFSLSPSDIATLAGQGIDASDISSFSFFTNQFDTNTSGVDIVATWNSEWAGGNTTWNMAFNKTDTEITRRDASLLNDARKQVIEDGVPDTRWTFTANHQMEKVRLLARVSHYGDYYDREADGVFGSNTLLDLEAGYDYSDKLTFTIGARNVTDEQGDLARDVGGFDFGAVLGLEYSQFTPFGLNGTLLYGRASYNF
jgi:iron complex outermembrane receptor protein